MKIWLMLLVGFLSYCFGAYMLYSPFFKDRPALYYPVSFMVGNAATFLWLYIARTQTENRNTLFYGNVWDFGLMAAYAIIPILFFGVKLNPMGLVGMAVVILGLVIFKMNL
jgi:multidrug transporter EmrE-like cation transporter